MPKHRLVFIFILLQVALGQMPMAAAASPAIRENLQYQVSLGPWDDVARVNLVFQEVGLNRYRAEFSGAAQGMWRLLNRWLPERYQTEMVYRNGRLQPLFYREEFVSHGRQVVKEYRFDYQRRRLTLWRQAGDGPRVKKWEVPLKEPVYDILSLYYNVRLGAFGPLPGGVTLRVAGLPTPQPQEMVFRIGPDTGQGRKVMLDYRLPESDTTDQYFIFLNQAQVPTLAWTRVTMFGKLSGRLMNPGGVRPQGLLAGSPSPAAVVAEQR